MVSRNQLTFVTRLTWTFAQSSLRATAFGVTFMLGS
jgi:hypothetical protein